MKYARMKDYRKGRESAFLNVALGYGRQSDGNKARTRVIAEAGMLSISQL
jgi:hypothetical protein